jgi:hypothetical protein
MEHDIHAAATLKQIQPLMRFLQMHHLAGLSRGLLRLIQPGDPPHHIRARLEQVGELLPLARHAVLATGPHATKRQSPGPATRLADNDLPTFPKITVSFKERR